MRFAFMLLSINITWLRWCNMFLDERFFHNCALTKRSLIRFADWSFPKTLDIFYCGSTTNAVCVFFWAFWAYFTQYLYWFYTAKVPCAHQSTRGACVRVNTLGMRAKNLFSEIQTRKFPSGPLSRVVHITINTVYLFRNKNMQIFTFDRHSQFRAYTWRKWWFEISIVYQPPNWKSSD